MMTRIVLLIGASLLVGCGGPEPARFVPAKANDAAETRDGSRAPARPSREVVIPRNIETH